MQDSQESFVMEHIRSDRLSLIEKIKLCDNTFNVTPCHSQGAENDRNVRCQ